MPRALKAAGGEVWIVGRRLERLRKAAEELGVRFIQGDITRGEDWDRIMETVGEVDILVNNAGIAVKVEPLLSFSDEEIFRSINGNLTGAILGCRRVAEKMVARKSGLIINVTSVCSHYGWPGFACYTAAKAGLDMFSRALYTELRPHNVRVTVLTPSWGATEFGHRRQLAADGKGAGGEDDVSRPDGGTGALYLRLPGTSRISGDHGSAAGSGDYSVLT